MDNDIVLRLLLALVISSTGLGLFWLANRRGLARARLVTQAQNHTGRPKLVYFTTPTCTPCKLVQRPAIEQVRQSAGEGLEVIEIDASQEPETARRWGVLSVPTTYLLDARGEPRFVNHGVTRAEKLMEQIQALNELN